MIDKSKLFVDSSGYKDAASMIRWVLIFSNDDRIAMVQKMVLDRTIREVTIKIQIIGLTRDKSLQAGFPLPDGSNIDCGADTNQSIEIVTTTSVVVIAGIFFQVTVIVFHRFLVLFTAFYLTNTDRAVLSP